MPYWRSLLVLVVLTGVTQSLAAAEEDPLDWSAVRVLFERDRAGAELSPDEQALLERARSERRQLQREGRWPPRQQGGRGGGEGRGLGLPPVLQQGPQTNATPLTQLEGEDGGLYGNGRSSASIATIVGERWRRSRCAVLAPAVSSMSRAWQLR